ncbi:MAG TPA: hypothetical protein EYP41_05060 [Anaerolineae bacterium]|nr:hypothetical protein [Anaerolineae bacterium]HIP72214.1 hypothetical protein [Anaerolineae bacterium]
MEGFTAVIPFKKQREAGFYGRPFRVGILGVQFPAFVKLGEGFALCQGEGVQAVVCLVVVEAGGETAQLPKAEESGQEEDERQNDDQMGSLQLPG